MLDRRKWTMRACTAGLLAAMILPGGASCTRAQASIVITQKIALPGFPFGVITTPDGRFVFASLVGSTNGIAVLARDRDTYQLIHVVPTDGGAAGLAGKAATVQTIDVGLFPREWARSPDGRSLYLTEFLSSTLDVFAVRDHFNALDRARD